MSRPTERARTVDELLEQWAELSSHSRPPALAHLQRHSGGRRLLAPLATGVAAIALLALVAVVILPRSMPAALPGPPEPTPSAVRAESESHPFRLVFEMPKTTWRAGEAIEGLARLELIEGDVITIGPPLGCRSTPAVGASSWRRPTRSSWR
jgi:hypothetical protein